jgi:hypothetical protein
LKPSGAKSGALAPSLGLLATCTWKNVLSVFVPFVSLW